MLLDPIHTIAGVVTLLFGEYSFMTQEPVLSGFHALSDPIRIQILELLQNEELCVSDMCQKLNIAQSRLSFHLKSLKVGGLVNVRQQGRWMYYSLNKEQFGHLGTYLSGY